jgi:hypothetical protein
MAFFDTAVLFGVMSVIGMTTKIDLTRVGSYLIMGVIGLVIAMIANMFFNSGPLGLIINIARHPEDQANGDGPRIPERRRNRAQAEPDGRAAAVSGLHQSVPVPAAPVRATPLISAAPLQALSA